ncbi:MAG: alpha-amylase family glycosyl hydrolase [bacterium]
MTPEKNVRFKRTSRCLFATMLCVLALCAVHFLFGNRWQSASAAQPVVSTVKHPEWSRSLSIYEVNLRQYTPEGTFKAFERHLPRLKDLGVGILWLMPIHPIGEENRKGSLGSYYSVKDYFAVNPEYGTMEDFESLVGHIHESGMYVILDWVANHTAWDNPLTTEHPEWFTQDSSGNFSPPVPDWSDVIDLNYDNRGLWEYMIRAMKFWVEETDVDGFRCDVAGMVSMEFWNEARVELEKVKPVFMLAEAEGPEFHEDAFDMTYSWNFYYLMHDIVIGKKSAGDMLAYFDEETVRYPKDAYRMRFLTNHDENSWKGTVGECFGDAAAVCAVLTATVPGMPLLYSGQEAGLDRRLLFFERDPIEWKEHAHARLHSTLFNLKRKSRALWNGASGGDMVRVTTSNDTAIFAFVRQKESEKVLVIANLSDREQDFVLTGTRFPGDYLDALTGDKTSRPANARMSLKAWGYRVFVE